MARTCSVRVKWNTIQNRNKEPVCCDKEELHGPWFSEDENHHVIYKKEILKTFIILTLTGARGL